MEQLGGETPDGQARRLYAEGRFLDLFTLSLARIHQDRQDVLPWMFAAVAAAELGDAQAFLNLHEQVHLIGGAARTCRNSLSFLLDNNKYDTLIATAKMIPQDNFLWIIAQYYIGCALLMKGDAQGGLRRLDRVKRSWKLYSAHIDFLNLLEFNILLRQALTVAGATEVESRQVLPINPIGIEFIGHPQGPQGVIFASANNLYFNAFGRCFVDNMMPMLGQHGLHLHIISPDEISRLVMDNLTTIYPGRISFSIEDAPPVSTTTYFACARFYTIDKVMAFHGADAISFDIDIAPTRPVDELFLLAENYEFSCFKTARNEPASVYQASIMSWKKGTGTAPFISALQHFCWPQLGGNVGLSWLLDQAALFSVLESGIPSLIPRFGDFTQLTGKVMHEWSRPIATEEAKRVLFLRGSSRAS